MKRLSAVSSIVNPLISAILASVKETFADSFGTPGVGPKNGASVSNSNWFKGVSATNSWNCCSLSSNSLNYIFLSSEAMHDYFFCSTIL